MTREFEIFSVSEMAGVRCFELLGEMWCWMHEWETEQERGRERRDWRLHLREGFLRLWILRLEG